MGRLTIAIVASPQLALAIFITMVVLFVLLMLAAWWNWRRWGWHEPPRSSEAQVALPDGSSEARVRAVGRSDGLLGTLDELERRRNLGEPSDEEYEAERQRLVSR